MADFVDQFKRYEFTAQGERITIDARSLVEAFSEANKSFPGLPQGAWMETQDVYNSEAKGFRWAEGNFFD